MKKSIVLSLLASQLLFIVLLPIWLELTKYLHSLVIGVVWFCFSSLALFIVCLVKKVSIGVSKPALHFVTMFYAIGLLVLLFFRPTNQSYESINLIPFETIIFYLSGQVDYLIAFYNLTANIGLFVPFGLYYAYVKTSPTMKLLLLISICSITVIEGTQFITGRGSLDIDDLILNVLGVCLGFIIHPLIQKVFILKQR